MDNTQKEINENIIICLREILISLEDGNAFNHEYPIMILKNLEKLTEPIDKLTQLTNDYNEWAMLKENHKGGIKLCDREMDRLKKEISELSKNDN